MKIALVLQSGSTVHIRSEAHLQEWEDRLKQLEVRYVKIYV